MTESEIPKDWPYIAKNLIWSPDRKCYGWKGDDRLNRKEMRILIKMIMRGHVDVNDYNEIRLTNKGRAALGLETVEGL